MSFVELGMNAGRICDGLSRIGYTPPAAITDIIDNSVTHRASHVWIRIVREREVSDSRKDNVKAYLIIDNGDGMNQDAMLNALSLGSSGDDYGPNSLSKFGLGLKSASFSQGETLEVISSDGSGPFLKYRVSLTQVRAENCYGAEPVELTVDDQAIIDELLGSDKGTIVRITDIRKNNHPSIQSTVMELQQRIGIIYYYFMQDGSLQIEVDSKLCESFDVLCTSEAAGNLDENNWNGREVRWIEKETKLPLDGQQAITALVEVTQLPHPPTFEADGTGQQTATRDKYHIGAGNYGFYVYRNKRLISWAERFAGSTRAIIPADQDYYSFRGRIQIDSSADDALNIDVKKSQIYLSDEAYQALDDFSIDCKRKSKRAWNHAAEEIRRRAGQDTTGTANRLAEQVAIPEELPGAPDSETAFTERQQREREIVEEQEQFFESEALVNVDEGGGEDGGDEISSQDREAAIQRAIEGESAGPKDHIFRVNNVEDHALWEPYYDPDKKNCVRINEVHRFARTIYQDNQGNAPLQILFDLILLQMATAEVYVEKNLHGYKRADIGAILKEYRRVASEFLAQVSRDIGDKLPRDEK